MLAGIIASPSAFDPKVYPENALGPPQPGAGKDVRTGLHNATQQYAEGIHKALPAPADIKPPTLESKAPYFTAFLRQQLVERYGAEKAYFGGLEVKSTLDLQLQEAAEEAVNSYLGYSPATASVVVIDNHTGGIKAMVGGPDFETAPFNLATQGRRQPGSSIKPFTLLTALEEGISPETEFPSEQRTFHFGKNGKEVFTVHNDEDGYLGSCSISCGLTYSDNSIYAGARAGRAGRQDDRGPDPLDRHDDPQGGLHRPDLDQPGDGARRPRRKASRRSAGPTPTRRSATTATASPAPSPRAPATARSPTNQVTKNGKPIKGGDNDPIHHQVFNQETVEEQKRILETVVSEGTGTAAQTGARKSGARRGRPRKRATPGSAAAIAAEVTACVWVGYPDTTTPMLTLYNGGPVMGGTFPALIWNSVMTAWEEIKEEHLAEKKAKEKAKEAKENEGKSGSEAEEEIEAGEYEESEYVRRKKPTKAKNSCPKKKSKRGGTGGGRAGRSRRTGRRRRRKKKRLRKNGGGRSGAGRNGAGHRRRSNRRLSSASGRPAGTVAPFARRRGSSLRRLRRERRSRAQVAATGRGRETKGLPARRSARGARRLW